MLTSNSRNSDSVDLGWGPRIYILTSSQEMPMADPETTFRKWVGWTIAFISQQKESITDAQLCQHLNLWLTQAWPKAQATFRPIKSESVGQDPNIHIFENSLSDSNVQAPVRSPALDSFFAQEKQPFLVLDTHSFHLFQTEVMGSITVIHVSIHNLWGSNLSSLRAYFFGCRQNSCLWLWLTVRSIPS